MKFYDLGDRLTKDEATALGFEKTPAGPLVSLGLPMPNQTVKAILTGEKRPPKQGEWYLSGAIPAAYRAYSDFSESMSFHLCRVVRVETVETTHIVRLV